MVKSSGVRRSGPISTVSGWVPAVLNGDLEGSLKAIYHSGESTMCWTARLQSKLKLHNENDLLKVTK